MSKEPFDLQIEKFRRKIEEISPLSSASESSQQEWLTSASAMLEELQVASEELRNQNQELYRSQILLLQESHRYQLLFESAPDAYLITDTLGIIKQGNQIAAQLLNVPQIRLVGKPIAAFLRGESLKTTLNKMRLLIRGQERTGWEADLYPRDRAAVPVLISAALQPDEGDPRGQVLWLIRDLTLSQQLEREIHEARERFRKIFEDAKIGIVLFNLEGRTLESNPAFRDIFQIPVADLYQALYPEHLQINNLVDESQQFQRLVKGEIDRYENEHVAWRQDGKTIWMRVIMSLLRDLKGQPQYALGFYEDTSLLHEQEREIIQLERYLEESDEKERAALARELHDGPLQFQISLIFDLQQVIASVDDPEVKEQLEKIREQARQVVGMLRTTSGLLRSPVLNTFGLDRAMLAYINMRQASTPTSIFVNIDQPGLELQPRVQQGIYRIFQNGLSNALRHADASQVIVRLSHEDKVLILEIEDDGQGFTVPKRWADLVQDEHYGLVGAAERAAAMGGSLQIHSRPGEGTLLRVSIPTDETKQRKSRLTDLGAEINQF